MTQTRKVTGWVTFTAYVDDEVEDPEGVEPEHLADYHYDNYPAIVWSCINEIPGIEFEWRDSELNLSPDPDEEVEG